MSSHRVEETVTEARHLISNAANRDLADGPADRKRQHVADESDEEFIVGAVPSAEKGVTPLVNAAQRLNYRFTAMPQ